MRRIPTFVLILALAGVPATAVGQTASAPATGAADAARAAQSEPAVGDQPVYDYGDKRPGQSQRLPRVWEGAPPFVPHAIKGLTPITAKRNACVGCHGRAGATSGPPPAPASHFVDLRESPETPRAQVVGSRWNCTTCHVPQTNAPALP